MRFVVKARGHLRAALFSPNNGPHDSLDILYDKRDDTAVATLAMIEKVLGSRS
jgi:hypothetical protein